MKNKIRFGLSRKKEFYLGLIISIILLIIIFIINISTTYVNNRTETLNKIEMVTDSVEDNLARTLRTIDNVSKGIFLSEEFQGEIENLYDEQLSSASLLNINNLFEKNLNSFDSLLIKDICYIPRNNSGELDETGFIHYGFSSSLFSNDLKTNLDNIIEESHLTRNLNGSLFLKQLFSFGNSSDKVCFARNVFSLRSHDYNEKLGIGIIVVNKSVLIDILQYADVIDGLAISFVYNQNTIFSSNEIDYSNKNDHFISTKSISLGFYDWKIKTHYDETFYIISIQETLISSVFVMFLVVGIYIMFYFMFHKKNLKSIYYLFDNFKQITNDPQLRTLEYIDDIEINKVIEAYNEMIASINSLNQNILLEKDRTIQYQVQRKDFEIKSLNAQINKHFIINVLSIIRSLVSLNKVKDASECLENLSDFLRYSLTLDTESYIKDELYNVKSYFNIQSIRYPKVNYQIDFDKSIEEIKVPRLIIQPLIENAYIHGLKKKEGTIEVCCKKEGNIVFIIVADDGGMISEDKIAQINNKIRLCEDIESTSETMHGIALTNIQKRLPFMYEEKATLSLSSADGKKTISTIRIEVE